MFARGDVAEFIYRIQKAVGATPDGDFDANTEAALKRWQAARGLDADGIAGSKTLAAMGLLGEVWLENGDHGRLVAALQERLGVTADRRFGDRTEDAVRRFQRQSGLQPDGIAGPKTLAALGLIAPLEAKSAPPRAGSRPAERSPAAEAAAARAPVRSWAYQLADIKPATIAALDVDVMVIDYAAHGDAASEFTPAEVARMRRRPGGGQKRVIAYLSIGEAESYRFYWRPEWSAPATRPAWLAPENPDWAGNFKVRFWDPQWQAIILGSPGAYLDRILAAGFDGVYLDIIDAFEYWEDAGEGGDVRAKMTAFVARIADYARARRPGFWIVPQNGEALLEDASYRGVISAIGKEDVFYGIDGDGEPNAPAAVALCLGHLAKARRDGIPILAIEYLEDAHKIADARQRLVAAGCVAYFGPRDLDGLGTG